MQRTQKSFTIGILAVGVAMVLGSIFSMVPASAQVAPRSSTQPGWGGNKLRLTPSQKEMARAIFREAHKEARGVFTRSSARN